jgi:hypothetical protein
MNKERKMDNEPQSPNTIEPAASPSPDVKKSSRKTIYWIIGGVLIVALLAGGVFMAMRLLNQKPQQALNGGGGGNLSLRTGGGPGGAGKSVSIHIIPSKELPQQNADMRGMVVKIENNSLYVGEMQQMMVSNINGKISTSPTPAGPYTEVVVSQDTKVYKDVTMDSMPDPSTASNGTTEVQQQLEAGSISDVVPGNTSVQVWGQKRGDRLIAEVVVLQGIGVIKGGPGK